MPKSYNGETGPILSFGGSPPEHSCVCSRRHSGCPLDSVVAEIDQDMVGRGLATDFPRGGTGAGGPTYLEVVGDQKISREFGTMLEAANAWQPVPFEFDRTYAAPGARRGDVISECRSPAGARSGQAGESARALPSVTPLRYQRR
jgi:hypothetical protein